MTRIGADVPPEPDDRACVLDRRAIVWQRRESVWVPPSGLGLMRQSWSYLVVDRGPLTMLEKSCPEA